MLRIRHRPRLIALAGASIAVIAMSIACGNNNDGERTFPGDLSDSAPPGKLPDAAAPFEAGPIEDAGSDARGAFDAAGEPVTCEVSPCPVELSAGEFHVCARMSDGTVRCWGDDSKGALGLGASEVPDGDEPDPGDGGLFVVGKVAEITNAAQVSAGGGTSCARLDDGAIKCWGANNKAQLGLAVSPPLSDKLSHPTPAAVALTSPAKRIDIGQETVFAVLEGGELWAWGDNAQRQLGRADTSEIGGPGPVSTGTLKIERATAGSHTVLATAEGGQVYSWGGIAGAEGRLSARIGALTPDPVPLPIDFGPMGPVSASFTMRLGGGSRARGIAHACAIVVGEVYCWGASNFGALGLGLRDPSHVPVLTTASNPKAWAQQVSAAGEISCARFTDGSVQCAGDDSRGALAREEQGGSSMFFVPAENFKGHAVQIVTTRGTVCALVQGGTVECWGSNQRGELGRGTTDTSPHPMPVKVGF